MVSLVWTTIVSLAVVILIGPRRMAAIVRPALVGPALLFFIEWIGVRSGYYSFPNSLLTIGGVSFFHILSGLGQGFIFVNWLPRRWTHILVYTIFMSLAYLGVEAVHILLGAFVHHPPWTLFRSAVLNLSAFLLYAGITFIKKKFTRKQAVLKKDNYGEN